MKIYNIEQDSTRVHEPKIKKKTTRNTFQGGRHCRREELLCQEYIPIGTYLSYAHRVG